MNIHDIASQLMRIRPRLSLGEQEELWMRVVTVLPQQKGAYRLQRRVLVPIIVFGIVGGGVTVFASDDALPGDVLYPIDRSFESIEIAFATPAKKDLLRVEFANERYHEVEKLVEREVEKHKPSVQVNSGAAASVGVSTTSTDMTGTSTTVVSAVPVAVQISQNEDDAIKKVLRDLEESKHNSRERRAKKDIDDVIAKVQQIRQETKAAEDSMQVATISELSTSTLVTTSETKETKRSILSWKPWARSKKIQQRSVATSSPSVASLTESPMQNLASSTNQEAEQSRGRNHEWNEYSVAQSANKKNTRNTNSIIALDESAKKDNQYKKSATGGNHRKTEQSNSETLTNTTTMTSTINSTSIISGGSATTSSVIHSTSTTSVTAATSSTVATTTATTTIGAVATSSFATSTHDDSASAGQNESSTTTLATGDHGSAPVQSDILVTAGSEKMTVSWNTNQFTRSRIYYSSLDPFDLSGSEQKSNSEYQKQHEMVIDGLSKGKTYRYQIKSENESEGVTMSSIMQVVLPS